MATTTLPPPSLVSADDFLKLHGDESGVELVNGVITRLPMPGNNHGVISGNAYHYVREVVKGGNLGRVMCNDSFVRTTPTGVRGADVSYISYSLLPADLPTPVGTITPPLELVIEVRSPTDSYKSLVDKANEHLSAGVTVVVVIDPETESLGVFRLNELPIRFHNGDVVVLPDILPGFAVPVAKFFE